MDAFIEEYIATRDNPLSATEQQRVAACALLLAPSALAESGSRDRARRLRARPAKTSAGAQLANLRMVQYDSESPALRLTGYSRDRGLKQPMTASDLANRRSP
jgi:hypothetical protein